MFLYTYLSCNYIYRYYEPMVENHVSFSLNFLLHHLAFYHSMAFSFLSFALYFALGMSLYAKSKCFHNDMVQNVGIYRIRNGLKNYLKVKALSTCISRVFGTPILFYYCLNVGFLAKLPDSSGLTAKIITAVAFLVLAPLTWLSLAEFHAKIQETMKTWLLQIYQNTAYFSVDMRIQLVDIRNDFLLDPAGISCKFFTVTYSFIGSVSR